jgi:hypothetical protein
VISPTQRPILDNTQHLQETNIHAPGGISNPQSQQARGRRPTPLTARPLGSSLLTLPPGKYNLLVTRLQCDWGLLSCIAFGTNDKCVSGSSVGIATDYGLDDPGSNPGWDEIFHPSRRALGTTQPPVKWVAGLSRGYSAAGACC